MTGALCGRAAVFPDFSPMARPRFRLLPKPFRTVSKCARKALESYGIDMVSLMGFSDAKGRTKSFALVSVKATA